MIFTTVVFVCISLFFAWMIWSRDRSMRNEICNSTEVILLAGMTVAGRKGLIYINDAGDYVITEFNKPKQGMVETTNYLNLDDAMVHWSKISLGFHRVKNSAEYAHTVWGKFPIGESKDAK
jgi:hypothetical protein